MDDAVSDDTDVRVLLNGSAPFFATCLMTFLTDFTADLTDRAASDVAERNDDEQDVMDAARGIFEESGLKGEE